MKWEYKTEIRLKALLSHHITHGGTIRSLLPQNSYPRTLHR